MPRGRRTTAFLAGAVLAACGSSKSSSPGPTGANHVVTLSWTANREAGVNRAGGGYTLSISGMAPVDVPYASGPAAPTSKDVTLASGTYTVTVSAYAALDPTGGTSRTSSAPSQPLTVTVP
jgi:MFS superfamily sulfate permease-like transporter